MEETAMTMTTLFSSVTEGVTAAAGWVGTYAETIADTPLLLAGCILGFVGFGAGLLRRLFNI